MEDSTTGSWCFLCPFYQIKQLQIDCNMFPLKRDREFTFAVRKHVHVGGGRMFMSVL